MMKITSMNKKSRNSFRMKGVLKCLALVAAAGLVTVSEAATCAAASPEFARSAEEWEHLRDNTLEWYEIPDLVIEYNAGVQKNRAELLKDERRSMDAREVTDWLNSEADDYEYLADTAASAMEAAGYRVQANQLRSQADGNVTDYEVLKLQNELLEQQTVKTVRNLFLNYYRAIAARDFQTLNIAYLERSYAAAVNRKNVGMATQLDVLGAEDTLNAARAEQITNEGNIATFHTNLITMCGWSYDAVPEIKEVPVIDPASLDGIDVNADLQQAEEKSYTLRTDRIKLNNARNEFPNLVTQYEDQLKADTETFRVSFRGAYDTLNTARFAYTNAAANLALQQQEVQTSERRLQLGLISPMEMEGVRNQCASLENAARAAYLDMVSAHTAYEMAKEGVL